MEPIADRKVHFAPLVRQQRTIAKLVRSGRFPNVTAFMRAAIDHYLDALGRPTLAQQAREMAAEYHAKGSAEPLEAEQARSMDTDEEW